MPRRWVLSLVVASALALGPSVVRAQAVPWNIAEISGTVVSANAASITVRDSQGFLREISLAGTARPALAPGMTVQAIGYRDGFGLQATQIAVAPATLIAPRALPPLPSPVSAGAPSLPVSAALPPAAAGGALLAAPVSAALPSAPR